MSGLELSRSRVRLQVGARLGVLILILQMKKQKSIVSDVEVIEASYINEAYKRTVASDVKYRFVIDAATF